MAMPWSDEEYQRERERLAAISQAPPIAPFDPSQFFTPSSPEPTPVAPPQEPGALSELGSGIARGLLTTGEGLSRLLSPILPGDAGAGLYNFFHAMQPEASEEQARWHAGLNQALAPYQGEYSDQHPFASTLGQAGAAIKYGLANLGKGTGSYLTEQLGQFAIPAGAVGLGAKVAGAALPRVATLAAKSPALTTALGVGSVSGLTDIGAGLGHDVQRRIAAGESPKAIFSGPNNDIEAAARHASMVALVDAATGGWMSKFGGRPMNAVLPWQRPLLRDAEAAITGATPNYTQALDLLDRAAQPATLRQRVGYGARDLGIGVAGQGVGEALGGIAQTGQYDPTQVALELAGGIGPAGLEFAFANQHRASLPQAYDDLRARIASGQAVESALAQQNANFQDFNLRDQQIQQALQLEQMQQAQADARVEANNAFARQYLQPQADPARLNLNYFNTMLDNPGIDPNTVHVPDAVKILDQYQFSPFEWPTIIANAKFNTPLATDNSILFSGLMTAREKVANSTDPIARKQIQEIDNQLVQLLPTPLRKNLPKVGGRYDATVLLPRVAAEIHKQVVDAARDGTQNAVLSQNTANFENSLAEYLNHAQDNFAIQYNNAAELQRISNRDATIKQANLQNAQVLQSDPETQLAQQAVLQNAQVLQSDPKTAYVNGVPVQQTQQASQLAQQAALQNARVLQSDPATKYVNGVPASPARIAESTNQLSTPTAQPATTNVAPSGLAARIKPTVELTTQRLPRQSATTNVTQTAPLAATETSQAAPTAEISKKKDLVTEESVALAPSEALPTAAELTQRSQQAAIAAAEAALKAAKSGAEAPNIFTNGAKSKTALVRLRQNELATAKQAAPETFFNAWQYIVDAKDQQLPVARDVIDSLSNEADPTGSGSLRQQAIDLLTNNGYASQADRFVYQPKEGVSDAQQIPATSETDAGRSAQPSFRQEGRNTAGSGAGVRTGGQEKGAANTSETHIEIVKRLDRAIESTANDSVAAQAQFTADVDENGPFAPGERVAFSKSIPPALQSWAANVLDLLGIKTRIFFTTQDDLNQFDVLDRYNLVGPFGYLLTREQGSESSSRAIRLRNGDYAIILRWLPSDSIGFKLESAAHEIGHAIEREVFVGASSELRKAVYAAFMRSREGAKYRTTKQHLASVLSPSVFSDVVRNTPQETLSKSATDLREYWWADFSEWFANQTARWAVSEAKPLSIVDKFFKSLADALRKLYASITGKTFLPTEEFRRLLNERTANTTFDSTLSLGESRSTLESPPGMPTDAHELRRSLDEAVRDLPQEMTSSFSNVAHSAGQQVYRAITKALNFGQLVEELKRIVPTSMHEVLGRLLDQRNAQRVAGHSHVEAVTQILRGVTSLPKEQQTTLQKTMNHNTFYGLHAEQPWSTHTWHNQTDSTMLAHFSESQKLWESLSPEAKTFYRQMRDLNIQLRQEYISAIEHSMSELHGGATPETQKLIKEMTDSLKSRQGDYFHLGRFGDINVIAWDENGKTVHHSMYADGAKALEDFYALKKAQPSWRVVHTRQKDYIATLDRVPSTAYAKMRDLIDRQIDKRAQQITKRKTLGWNQKQSQIGNLNQLKESMRQSLAELYLHTLPPDMTSAQRQRRGIPGFSEEAVRVFAENAIQASRNIANVRYSPLIEKTFNDLEHQLFSHTRSGTDESTVAAMDLYNTMRQQYANIKKDNTPRAVTAISQLGFAYMLGRPIKLLHNALQTWFVAAPRLMAEYGESASLGALSKYTRQYLMRAKDTGNPVIDRILHQLQETGDIDFTQYAEVMDFVNGKNYQTLYNRALTGLGWFMHKSEMYNRQVTAAATVDLALRKNPRLAERDAEGNLIHEKELMQIATKQLNDSHGDYSAEGRPVVMQGPVRKLLFMFRRYSIFMMYRLAADTREIINDTAQIKQLDKQIAATTDATLRGELVASRDAVVENRKQFVKTLGYIFGINGATMGLLGLPLAGQVAMLANALIGGLQSDDDEPYDVVRELKLYLNKQLPKTVTDTIVHGGTFSTLGMDMSQSVGLGYLLPFLPDRLSPAKSYDDSFNTTLVNALGPAAGLVRNLFVGSMAGGNAALSFARNEPTSPKVMEELLRGLPAIVKDFHGALKMYATGEYRTVSGKTSLSRNEPRFTPDALDVAYRAIGQTPATATRAYSDFGHAMAYKEQIKTRRSELFNMWFNAVQGTQHQRSQALAAINRFNEKNPQFKITAESLRASVEQKRLNYALSRRGNYTGDKDLTGTQFAPLVPRI